MGTNPTLFNVAADAAVENQMMLEVAGRTCDYQEQIIHFKIGDEIFPVSSGRLTMRSPLFKQMVSLPQVIVTSSLDPPEGAVSPDADIQEIQEPIDCSDIDREAFMDYLWYIHADPMISRRFFAQGSGAKKCLRLLRIGLVAHRFEATDLCSWAVSEALQMLCERKPVFKVELRIAKLLLELSGRMQAPELSFIASRCRDVVCDALHPDRKSNISADPTSVLEFARDDRFVLAHVYFYILGRGQVYDWKADIRLLPIDRLRLLCGSYGLAHSANTAAPNDFDVPPGTVKVWGVVPAKETTVMNWEPMVPWDIGGKRDKLWEYFDEGSWGIPK